MDDSRNGFHLRLAMRSTLRILALGSALAGLTSAAGCPKSTQPKAGAESCMSEPVGKVVAYLPEPEELGLYRFAGTFVSWTPAAGSTSGTVQVHGKDGRDRAITCDLVGLAPPLATGTEYTFQVEHAGRFPTTSALVVWDALGVRLIAVSDLTPGATVLSDGLAGWAAQLLPATCDSRPHDDCYTALRNRPLQIFHDGKSVTLMHGEQASLAGYQVRCLTAQEAQLSDRCADAGVIGVSYTIVRQ